MRHALLLLQLLLVQLLLLQLRCVRIGSSLLLLQHGLLQQQLLPLLLLRSVKIDRRLLLPRRIRQTLSQVRRLLGCG